MLDMPVHVFAWKQKTDLLQNLIQVQTTLSDSLG